MLSKQNGLCLAFVFTNLILLYHIFTRVYVQLLLLLLVFVSYKYLKRTITENIGVQGKGVLVTGCDTGFGHDLALRLESLGCRVYAGCLCPEGDGAKKLKETKSSRMHVLHLDVTKDEHVAAAKEFVGMQNTDEVLWAIVNNAAIERILDVELVPLEQMKRLAEVNFYGIVRVTKAFIPMIRKSKGRIVNVTSVKGRLAIPHDVSYCVTKYAAEAFSDCLRREMYKFGVKVSVIEPGYFDGATGMLNMQYCDKMEEELKEAWKTFSPDVQALYGWDYVRTLVQRCRDGRAGSCYSSEPVMDAMVHAIANPNPQTRYIVHGSKNWVDIWAALPVLSNYLPEELMDWYIRRLIPPPKLAIENS